MDQTTSKKSKSVDGGSRAWSFLHHDLLLLIMMQLETIDFLAFSKVCRSWRSLACLNKDNFMASKQPMVLSGSSNDKGRVFKAVFPTPAARTCVGLSCGYLVMFGKTTQDFLLVNPITGHQLHFPGFHISSSFDPARIRAILVFSPLMSGWVLVITIKHSRMISFSLAGELARWNHLLFNFCIYDLHVFKGKIYTINDGKGLCEMRLNPVPTLIQLNFKSPPEVHFLCAEFVSSDNNLYVLGSITNRISMIIELDLEKRIWVSVSKTVEDHDFFLGYFKCAVAVKRETWDVSRIPFVRSVLCSLDKNQTGKFVTALLWYFPHVYSNVNLLEE